MQRCAIYARVSAPDWRMENQRSELRLFARQRGYEVVSEYTDVTVSSPNARRPGLGAMMRDARKKKFEVVIVAAFVQVARSTKHFLSVVKELENSGVDFVSLRENLATNDANGREFYTIIRSLVELETDLIRERIRAGMRRRKLEGLPIGRQMLHLDHESLVQDRLRGMSLTQVAERYGVSRASVVRWVKEAQQTNPALSVARQSVHGIKEEAAA
jgi:DNA invertase Pin-like site-specific DNA recombinase